MKKLLASFACACVGLLSFTALASAGTGPTITLVTPSSGPIGTDVIVTGYGGFDSNSHIFLNGHDVGGVASSYGAQISFVLQAIPGVFDGSSSQVMSLSVQNQNGMSNSVNFTGTPALAASPVSAAPVINTIFPASVMPMSIVGLSGTGFSTPDQGPGTVLIDGNVYTGVRLGNNIKSTAATVEIPYYINRLDFPYGFTGLMNSESEFSDIDFPLGVHYISIRTSAGTSNPIAVTVRDYPVLTSISPSSAAVGDTVTITGNGFEGQSYVYFGDKTFDYVQNNDGAHLTFAIPKKLRLPCTTTCPPLSTPITPGDYSITVKNETGSRNLSAASNAVTLTITGSKSGNTEPKAPVAIPFTVSCSPAGNPDGTPIVYKVGDKVVFNATVTSSGNPPDDTSKYTYVWSRAVSGSGTISNGGASITSDAFAIRGQKNVTIKVTNPNATGADSRAVANCSVTISPDGSGSGSIATTTPAAVLQSVSCMADPKTVNTIARKTKDRTVSYPVTFTAYPVPSAGSYTYKWSGSGITDSASPTLVKSWSGPGNHTAHVIVIDTSTKPNRTRAATCSSSFTLAPAGSPAAVFDSVSSFWDSLWR